MPVCFLSSLLDRLSIIREPTYIPNEEDIIRCRVTTTAITGIDFSVQSDHSTLGRLGLHPSTGVRFRVFDVGGQRGERRKWIQLFDRIMAVQYVLDLACFDQYLREDESKNRLLEGIETFDDVWNNRFLR